MKREGQENNMTPRSDGIHVPLDLTVEILSKLPVKSLVRLQCVSKLWSSLITESIMTWSLTKPRLLVLFDQPLLDYAVFSLSGQVLNTFIESVCVKQDTDDLVREKARYENTYQYNRGLICRMLRWGQFAIYNPTTREALLLPEIKPVTRWRSMMRGFFGYDPIGNQYKVLCMICGIEFGPRMMVEESLQVYTLGDPKNQWRKIQGFGQSFSPRSNKVCINGKISFRAGIGKKCGDIPIHQALGTVLLSFDVMSERFDHALLPTQPPNMNLVNYQGKLGCISYDNNSLEMWIMDHSEKQEWLKIEFFMSSPLLSNLRLDRIIGVTLNGEVVIMPKSVYNTQTLYADYYDPKQKNTRRVEFERTEGIKIHKEVIFSVPDHVENTMSLCSMNTLT